MNRQRYLSRTVLSFALALVGTACFDESRANVFAFEPDAGEAGPDDFVFESGAPCEGDCGREAGADIEAGTGKDGGGGQSGESECVNDNDCGDGNACTRDLCDNGICRHDLVANPSEAGCPAGHVCDAKKGCVPGPPCATYEHCEALLGGDPCKTNFRCNASTATCEYSILDRDRDGDPPLSCGGGDCDDTDPRIHAGHPELCDGKDNNCNGLIDEGSVCEDSCGLSTCPEPSYPDFFKCCTNSEKCGLKNGPSGFCYDIDEGGGGGSGGGFP